MKGSKSFAKDIDCQIKHIMIMEQPMVVKIAKNLLTKNDQTTKIKFV
jgi:hypothetical protein